MDHDALSSITYPYMPENYISPGAFALLVVDEESAARRADAWDDTEHILAMIKHRNIAKAIPI